MGPLPGSPTVFKNRAAPASDFAASLARRLPSEDEPRGAPSLQMLDLKASAAADVTAGLFAFPAVAYVVPRFSLAPA